MIDLETMQFIAGEDGVGQLRLNRPDVLNAQNPAMWLDLTEMMNRLSPRQDLRCLVVTGAGRSLSAGFDGTAMSSLARPLDTPEDREERRRQGLAWTEGFAKLSRAPFVTIAAIRGHALGAGFELAVACDLRVVTPTARLSAMGIRFGLIPDTGTAYWLPRLVGLGKARELILTGMTIEGSEAGRIGLAEHVVDDAELDACADRLARSIAAHSGTAVRAAKRVLEAGAELTFEQAREVAQREQADCYSSADFLRAASALGARVAGSNS
ncbi:enoyl-CoA hydratase/isomerase family protein [Nocardia uniformis]|uniref:Enoyl-CoA hydratase/isomerase family protein n=1 Tax=Nocardia uniformis TaxID=53432 RepID=A0A849BXB5_9NOCA|nr:enoyl-CoA hydratase/isomerase family protein [Nocardia uniformis]NNH71182.1 enoyl-CoA hydratase/isomerase family protein [Nocardia uniformis]